MEFHVNTVAAFFSRVRSEHLREGETHWRLQSYPTADKVRPTRTTASPSQAKPCKKSELLNALINGTEGSKY